MRRTTRMRARAPLYACIVLGAAMGSNAYAQAAADKPISLSFESSLAIPLSDTALFGLGGGGAIIGEYSLGRGLGIGAELGVSFVPLSAKAGTWSMGSLGARTAYDIRVAPWLIIRPEIDGGYFFGAFSERSGSIG